MKELNGDIASTTTSQATPRQMFRQQAVDYAQTRADGLVVHTPMTLGAIWITWSALLLTVGLLGGVLLLPLNVQSQGIAVRLNCPNGAQTIGFVSGYSEPRIGSTARAALGGRRWETFTVVEAIHPSRALDGDFARTTERRLRVASLNSPIEIQLGGNDTGYLPQATAQCSIAEIGPMRVISPYGRLLDIVGGDIAGQAGNKGGH